MSRKTKTYVADNGRDKGKHFLITEMDAFDGERWATRVLMGLARSGVPVPEDVMYQGMAGLAYFSVRSFLAMEFATAEPLLEEMMACVQFIPDPKHPNVTRPVDKEDIEEVLTVTRLRSEVFEVHTGFSLAGWVLKLMNPSASNQESSSPATSTSPEQ